MRRLGQWRKLDERGATAVEFALIVPMLLLCLAALTDLTRGMMFRTDLAQSVTAGLQYAVANPADLTGVETAVMSATGLSADAGFTLDAPITYWTCGSSASANINNICATGTAICSYTCPDGLAARRYISLSVSYAYEPIFGGYAILGDHVSANGARRLQ